MMMMMMMMKLLLLLLLLLLLMMMRMVMRMMKTMICQERGYIHAATYMQLAEIMIIKHKKRRGNHSQCNLFVDHSNGHSGSSREGCCAP